MQQNASNEQDEKSRDAGVANLSRIDLPHPSQSSVFFSRISRLAKDSIRAILDASRVFSTEKTTASSADGLLVEDGSYSPAFGKSEVAADELNLPEIAPAPFIFFNTMPKSGSVFIVNWLARGLTANVKPISYGYFPNDMVGYSQLKDCAGGNAVSQEHIDACETNRHFLRQFVDKMVVHIRDPRQATLSWLHHVNQIKAEQSDNALAYVYPSLPSNYFDFEFERQVDWQIDHHLPLLIDWTRKWVEAESNWPEIKLLFTRYEEFVADRGAFMDRILNFFEIPADRFDSQFTPELSMANHYRKGQTDEWRSVYSQAQIERANQFIPKDLAEKFGWQL